MIKNKEYQAGATLVDEGITFKVPLYFGIKVPMTIRPLRGGTLIRISQEVALMGDIDVENQNMIQELLKNGHEIKRIASVIAHAVINREIYKRPLFRFYRWLILNRVENMGYIFSYLSLVYRQIDAEHFFFIMASAKRMNHLQKKTSADTSQAGKPSGVPSA